MPRKSTALPPWMAVVFPLVATTVALIAVHWRVLAGASPGLYIIPVLIGAGTFLGLRRVMREKELPSTTHQYSVFAPASKRVEPTLAELLERLTGAGYQPDTVTLDDVGAPGPRPGHAIELIGAQLRITDKRGDAELGSITVRLRRADDGGMVGLVEGVDTGPGVYDEMAQFAIVALGQIYAGLEYLAAGKPERKSVADLRATLPDTPLGLALL